MTPGGTIDLSRYATVLFDLDGTLLIGQETTPGAPAFVAACRRAGAAVGFITNASLPTRLRLRGLLRDLGLAEPDDVVFTSSMALATRVRADGFTSVLCAGHDGLRAELAEAGLEVHSATAVDVSVAAGLGREGAVALGLFPQELPPVRDVLIAALNAGAPCYVPTLEANWPTPTGLQPGNGATVELLRASVAAAPIICGKPSSAFVEALRLAADLQPQILVVGDTWGADVALARANGWDCMLTLTGSTSADMALTRAAKEGPPTYVVPTLTEAVERLASPFVR